MLKHLFLTCLFLLAGVVFFTLFFTYGILASLVWNTKFFFAGRGEEGLNDLIAFPGEIWEIFRYGEWPI